MLATTSSSKTRSFSRVGFGGSTKVESTSQMTPGQRLLSTPRIRHFAASASSSSSRSCPIPKSLHVATLGVLALSSFILVNNQDSFDHTAGPRSGLAYYPAHHHYSTPKTTRSHHDCLASAISKTTRTTSDQRKAIEGHDTAKFGRTMRLDDRHYHYGGNRELMWAERMGKSVGALSNAV